MPVDHAREMVEGDMSGILVNSLSELNLGDRKLTEALEPTNKVALKRHCDKDPDSLPKAKIKRPSTDSGSFRSIFGNLFNSKMDSEMSKSPSRQEKVCKPKKKKKSNSIAMFKEEGGLPGAPNVTSKFEKESKSCLRCVFSQGISIKKQKKARNSIPDSSVKPLTEESTPTKELVISEEEWETDFLNICARVVQMRYARAAQIALVKPFNERYPKIFEITTEAEALDSSVLDHHQISSATKKFGDHCEPTEEEKEILTKNFFQVALAYRMRHPYMLVGLQTGLESKKDIYDFALFRHHENLTSKLCYGLPTRSALWCNTQLRYLLIPEVLPLDAKTLRDIVAHLFVGFGPDWPTLSRMTGLGQSELKEEVGEVYGISYTDCPIPVWYQVHQEVIEKTRKRLD